MDVGVPRVLLLIKGLGGGGAEQLLAGLVRHRDRQRFDYEVAYLLPAKDALVEDFRDEGVPVRCLGGAGGRGWLRRLRRLLRGRRFRLLHVHSPLPAIGARLVLGPRVGAPPLLVYTEHGIWDHYDPRTRWANMLTYWRNDHVFAVSDFVASFIRYPGPLRFLPMPPVETRYYGLEHNAVARWGSPDGIREELNVPAEAPMVVTVANFRPQKRHDFLVRAAAEVRRAVPDVRFVLVGTGPLEPRVRALVRRLGLEGTVHFAGFRPDAPRVVAAGDVFALPSAYEGLSIALVEAMALGLPVATTRVGGVSEVVHDGEDALVAAPDDAHGFARNVVTLLRDPDLAGRLSRAAKRRAEFFRVDRAARRHEEVYGELLDRVGGSPPAGGVHRSGPEGSGQP